jgi:AcrR family transcriptional regulator
VKRKGAETREAIVENALQLFSVKGYHNTSVNDILAATGLTKGGLYGHFGSKEEIWEAAYARAVEIWTGIVFRDSGSISDPLERIARVIENDLRDYVGARVFKGGCIFFNLLVELSGQNQSMADQILRGYDGFSRLLARWLDEAKAAGMLRPEADSAEMTDFIVVALNGATALFSARQDPHVLDQTIRQLRSYLDGWRAQGPIRN